MKYSAVYKEFGYNISKSELFGNNIIDFEYILIDINKSQIKRRWLS